MLDVSFRFFANVVPLKENGSGTITHHLPATALHEASKQVQKEKGEAFFNEELCEK